jgi:hypothetical protein
MLRQSPLGRWRMQRDAAHLLIIAVKTTTRQIGERRHGLRVHGCAR